ncbi:MAG: helix-turn-helix domain-containing protein, partial [Moraxellaceae bacterium]|nr:helix-turn-helix domain-containing protein [Moraxellaceae bacterium]
RCPTAANGRTLSASFTRGHAGMQPIFLSINDTAKALGLGRTSIYALLRSGRLEAVKLGRRTLVKVESIRRLIETA